MDEKALTEKTVLEWLTLEMCASEASPTIAEGGRVFPCGLALTDDHAGRVPMAQAGEAVRLAHERHHQFGHKPTGQLYGIVTFPAADGFTASCYDCDPFPELGIEYDRGQLEGVLPPW